MEDDAIHRIVGYYDCCGNDDKETAEEIARSERLTKHCHAKDYSRYRFEGAENGCRSGAD